ncbi:MAG: hypothetical protein IK070_01790 [Clostridia bacterium]|nr:hypothetical protein [Clostridia bacterium]
MENKEKSYKFEYILCDGPNPEDWAAISLEELQKLSTDGKAIVINFGGNGTKQRRTAISYGKTMRTLLGTNSSYCHVISVNYNESTTMGKGMYPNITHFVRNVIKPMFFNPYEQISYAEARKHLRALTFFGHCHGAYGVLENMEYALQKELKKFTTFNAKERAELLSQIVCFTYGSTTNLKYLTEFNCTSYNDNVKKFEGNAVWAKLFEEHFDEVDIPAHEKAKLYASYKKFKAKDKEMLNFVKKYLNKNDRIYSYKENAHKVVFATGHLTHKIDNDPNNTNGGDHLNIYMRFADNYSRNRTATKSGEYMSRITSCVLCSSAANSYRNLHSPIFKPFDVNITCNNISHFVSPLNYAKELKLSDKDMFNLPSREEEMPVEAIANPKYKQLFELEK